MLQSNDGLPLHLEPTPDMTPQGHRHAAPVQEPSGWTLQTDTTG